MPNKYATYKPVAHSKNVNLWGKGGEMVGDGIHTK